MLLFLMGVGVDIPTILLISFLLFIFGLLIFRLSRIILRKTLKGVSERRANTISRVLALLLAPILLIGAFALVIFISIEMKPDESGEESASSYYKIMEEDIAKDIRIGMSKIEILELLGDNDTTQSVMVYDMSLPNAKEKYILEVSFEEGRLTSFRRQQ